MDTYTHMCAHRQTYIDILIYIFFFFSSSWSGYNYLNLQGILRALPGSSNKVHRIVERSKGNITEGEEQNSFLSCIIPCNRSTPLKIIIVGLEPSICPLHSRRANVHLVQLLCTGATMWLFPFWWISSCFQLVWTHDTISCASFLDGLFKGRLKESCFFLHVVASPER